MAKAVIEVRNVSIGYGDVTVLNNLDFQVNKGEIFVILGGSGCGKSTLLKNIIGLYKPFSGDIIINGQSIVTSQGEMKRNIMRNFGVLYQSGALFGSLTVAENIALLLDEYTSKSKDEIDAIIAEKLEVVDLDGFEDFMPSELSGGMKKRAGLARAMALDPDLLFFDEPSAGLDPISSAKLDELLLNLRDKFNCTMVIVTHELDSIFAVADRVIILDREERGMVAMGDPRVLRESCENKWVLDFLNRLGMKRD